MFTDVTEGPEEQPAEADHQHPPDVVLKIRLSIYCKLFFFGLKMITH